MDTRQIVKNKILLNKIAEYFAKNPKKDSVVVKADFGENKVYWRAVRESVNRFRVTEVKTVTESFIFEVSNAGAQPSSKASKKADKSAKADKKADKAEVPVSSKPLMTISMVTQQ